MNIIEEKLQEKKPLIVDFGSSTCIPCKMIKPVLEEISKDYDGKVNVLILDTGEYGELAQEFQVMSIPSQFFFDAEGKLLGNHIGFLPKEAFEEIVKEHFKIEK